VTRRFAFDRPAATLGIEDGAVAYTVVPNRKTHHAVGG